jgi:hypothetical protein
MSDDTNLSEYDVKHLIASAIEDERRTMAALIRTVVSVQNLAAFQEELADLMLVDDQKFICLCFRDMADRPGQEIIVKAKSPDHARQLSLDGGWAYVSTVKVWTLPTK